MSHPLPVIEVLPRIKKALQDSYKAVIQAPPGAGKTTRVPLELLGEPWLEGKKIILLEPRRLAAVSCARHMAGLLGEPVGRRVGYQIRLDSRFGKQTRILVVTQGIFTRLIQSDPMLENIGLVIFDEFHERQLQTDLGLALCLESADAFRPDLRVLVMSATLDIQPVAGLMDDAPVVISKGRAYPVETRYIADLQTPHDRPTIERRCARAIQTALQETKGDILVFLPGVGEIRRLSDRLKDSGLEDITIVALYGNLSAKDQAGVFKPAPKGKRKIVLSTSIAETSVTIDGIGVVIDSGLMRVPKFNPVTGMTRLETIPVSKACADQRRGRAGRTAPGVCYRLWSEYSHSLLKPFSKSEIMAVDLCGFVLELRAWGVTDVQQLKWLDLPPDDALRNAEALLIQLGALDEQNRITEHGRDMAITGLHPRLSHMVLVSRDKGIGYLGCRLAALLMERDFIRFSPGYSDPDIGLRLELIGRFSDKKKPVPTADVKINTGVLRRILDSERKIAADFHIRPSGVRSGRAGELLAHAYPDRIAKKRDNQTGTYLSSSGKGFVFKEAGSLLGHDMIVAVHVDGNPKNAAVFLAAPYPLQTLEADFKHRFVEKQEYDWDKNSKRVTAENGVYFDRICISRKPLADSDPDRVLEVLLRYIETSGLDLLPWTAAARKLVERVCFLRGIDGFGHLPDFGEPQLTVTVEQWLAPFLSDITSEKQLARLDMESVLGALLSYEMKKQIDLNAPTHIVVPSGSKKKIRYSDKNGLLDSPVLEVRLQEMFGLTRTPSIAGGRVVLTLYLLSPAGRAVQITKDLDSFWKNTYPEVKKDLMGRYPKHYWPDDPFRAVPTSRVKPKRKGS